MNWLIISLVMLQVGDFLTTAYGVKIGLVEANSWVARLMAAIGTIPALLLIKVAAAALSIYAATFHPYAAWGLIVLYTAAVAWNLRLIIKKIS